MSFAFTKAIPTNFGALPGTLSIFQEIKHMEEHNNNNAEIATLQNPHVLWRQLLGLTLWTAIPGFFLAGIPGLIASLLLGGLTFVDTWNSGIWKNSDQKSFTNLSPMGWGVAMSLLLIITYPAYLLVRNKKVKIPFTNGYYYAVVVLGGLALLSAIANIFIGVGADAA